MFLPRLSAPWRVARSLNFASASTEYLTRTPGGAGNRRTWTWCTWIKRTNLAGTRQIMFVGAGSYGAGDLTLEIQADNTLLFVTSTDGAWNVVTTNTIADTAWHHICVKYDTTQAASADRLRIYLDGTECSYGTNTRSAQNYDSNFNTAAEHRICYRTDNQFLFNGNLADTYFIDGTALTPDNFISGTGAGTCVPIRYRGTSFGTNGYWLTYFDTGALGTDDAGGAPGQGSGSSDWTPTNTPTTSTDAPTGYDAAQVLLLHAEGADASTTFTDSSAYQHGMTFAGNAQIDTAQFKFGSSSILLDGTGDFVFPNNTAGTDFVFGTGDFTIDFWIRPTTNNATAYLYDGRSGTGSAVIPAIYTNAGTLAYRVSNVDQISGGVPAANTWSHVAVARSGTSTKMFLNGTQVGSTYSDSNNYVAPATNRPAFGIAGDGATSGFTGHMDEIRVSKGVARWTADFTPPTAPYTGPYS